MSEQWRTEVADGKRFEFGSNWGRFLRRLDQTRVRAAEDSLKGLLGMEALKGKTFLDAGSGSGLFSLAARRLGASVTSFDFDPSCVACTRRLRVLFHPDDADWTVLEGSALDPAFLAKLPESDVVYSWGVLHHTGEMWRAVDLVSGLTAPGGLFALALYNTQPLFTPVWKQVKRLYCALPVPGKLLLSCGWAIVSLVRGLGADIMAGRNVLTRYSAGGSPRGMDFWRDVVDWVGGHPFETARPEEVLAFLRPRGFELANLRTVDGRLGCNEFVFVRKAEG